MDPGTGGPGDFLTMAQPAMPDVEAAHVPVNTPQDLEKRKAGWMELVNRFQSNPNLQRAMMLVGANMMQPLQPGQTAGGALANSAVVGMNAYQQGQQADLAQKMALRKEGREDVRLDFEAQRLEEAKRTGASQREAAGVATDTARERLPAVRAETERTLRTLDDVVRSSQLQRKQLELAVDKTERGQYLEDLERDLKEMQVLAQKGNLDTKTKQEMELAEATLKKVKAEATTAAQEAELGPEGRARLKTTTTTTAEGVRAALLDKWWNDSPTLQRQHPDKSAWLANATTETKRNPATLLKAVSEAIDATGSKDPERPKMEALRRQLIDEMAGTGEASPVTQPGASAPAKPAAAPRNSVTMDEVRATAKARGVSEQTIINALKKKGVKVINMQAPVPNPREAR